MTFREGPDWGLEGIKVRWSDGHRDRNLGLGDGLGCPLEKPQHPGNSGCLVYTVEIRSHSITDSWKSGQGLRYTAGSK